MSYHARPLAAPGGMPAVTTSGPDTPTVTEASPVPRATPAAPPARSSEPAPRAPDASIVADEPSHTGPWYRTESWLVVALAGFLPMLLALAVPQGFRVPLVGVSGVLIACGMVMLARRGAP